MNCTQVMTGSPSHRWRCDRRLGQPLDGEGRPPCRRPRRRLPALHVRRSIVEVMQVDHDDIDVTKVATTPTSRSSEEYVPVIGDRPEGTDVWLRVPYDPADYGPVQDYATDFDHADPAYNPIAPKIWKELREHGCPVAHSERYGGMWVPLTHDTVNAVAYDTDNFTSRSVVVSVGRPGDLAMPAPIGGAPPITSDPPFHGMARRLLLPAFAPKQIEPWEPEVRRLCRELLGRLTDITPGETVIDAAVAYAQNIPVNVIGRMLGFPAEDERAVPQVRPRRPRTHRGRARCSRRIRRPRRLHPHPSRRPPRQSPRRSHELSAHGRARRTADQR